MDKNSVIIFMGSWDKEYPDLLQTNNEITEITHLTDLTENET